MREYGLYMAHRRDGNIMSIFDEDNRKFIQHNDYKNYETHYQCARCKSFDVEKHVAFSDDTPKVTLLSCQDCHQTGKPYKG